MSKERLGANGVWPRVPTFPDSPRVLPGSRAAITSSWTRTTIASSTVCGLRWWVLRPPRHTRQTA